MTSHDLESVAQTLVAGGKGILAADETIPTLTRRFDTLGSVDRAKPRTYREMLFTSPGAAEFISGVIMQDETIRQKSSERRAARRSSDGPRHPSRHQGRHRREAPRRLSGRDRHRGARRSTGSSQRSIVAWVPVSRSGGRSFMSRTPCRVPPACAQMRMRWRGTLPSVRSRSSCRSSSRKCSWTGRTQSSAARRSPAWFSTLFSTRSRAGRRARGDAAQAQHGSSPARSAPPGLGGGGRDRDVALLAPACSRRGAGDRLPLRRPDEPAGDRSSERDQSAAGPETLEDQFLLRAGASGSGAGGLAWTRRELAGRPASSLSPGQLQWRGESRELHR